MDDVFGLAPSAALSGAVVTLFAVSRSRTPFAVRSSDGGCDSRLLRRTVRDRRRCARRRHPHAVHRLRCTSCLRSPGSSTFACGGSRNTYIVEPIPLPIHPCLCLRGGCVPARRIAGSSAPRVTTMGMRRAALWYAAATQRRALHFSAHSLARSCDCYRRLSATAVVAATKPRSMMRTPANTWNSPACTSARARASSDMRSPAAAPMRARYRSR